VKSLIAAVLAAVALSSACTGSGKGTPDTTTTQTQTVTHTRTPTATFTPRPVASVVPLTPDESPPKGAVDGKCPYIGSNFTDGTPNVADIEGDRVYRTVVLTTMKPVGCRFYFYAPPYEAVADIVTQTFASPTDARNAMIATGDQGHHAEGVPSLVPGVQAVLYQTEFFGPNGSNDWACVFAKGSLMVIVHTQQSNLSFNARELAKAIAPKI
jgi:hypothetical protein